MRKKSLLLVIILLLAGSSELFASQYTSPSLSDTYTVVAKPLINYSSDQFERTSLIRDVWNETFEHPLASANHYWYGGSLTQIPLGTGLNNTLDSGFEELPSDTLNLNLSMPQWFRQTDSSNVTIRADLSHSIVNGSLTSATVETRFINTTNGFGWRTPVSIYSSCGYSNNNPASKTIDGNTGTYWEHSTSQRHYVIYDLGTDYLNNKVQVYSGSGGRINDVYIYVSTTASDFGTAVVSGWSPSTTGWTSSPEFVKRGRYIKLDFWTTTGGPLSANTFCEFQASTAVLPSFHAGGGVRTISDYFVNVSGVHLSASPFFTMSLFLDDATTGSGYATAYYSFADIEIRNPSRTYHIVYVAPATAAGTPSSTHFTNTTTTKYIYGAATLNQFDTWKKYTRDLKSDYEKLWGAVKNAALISIALKGDLYQPLAVSTSNPPLVRFNYDPVSLKKGGQEQLVNGDFESQGWRKTEQNKLQTSICTKTSVDKTQGSTSYSMNVTGDTSGGSGLGFSATKHQAVGTTAFIRETSDAEPFKLRANVKIVDTSSTSSTEYSYVGLRITFQNKSAPYNLLRLFYVIMVRGFVPSSTGNEKYIQLVESAQTGVWYEIVRNPVLDSGWANVKVTELAMVVAFYYGSSYGATSNAHIAARFDYVRLINTGQTAATYVNNLARSSAYKRDGSWSLKLNATSLSTGFAIYEAGAENGNNSYYIAFPRNMNLSSYFYVPSYSDSITVQFSLAIDDGPAYGEGYTYELIYYYGSQIGVGSIFSNGLPTYSKLISSSVPQGSWVHVIANWTKDMPGSWTAISPRVEAVGVKVWTSQASAVNVYFDLVGFYGKWYGAKKILRVSDATEVSIRKFNVTDVWGIHGNVTDLGGDYPPDNNASNVDGSPGIGSHSDFRAVSLGPDSIYDTLSEGIWGDDSQYVNHYIDNNVSNVDNKAGSGSHSNFQAQKNSDGIYDVLSEQWMGPHIEINDYVDSNASNVDNVLGKGIHSNFNSMKTGPDSQFDTLTESNIYPPPNNVNHFADINASNVDNQLGTGVHSNFPAVQLGPDGTYDVLTERNGAPPPEDHAYYPSDNTTDVDGNGGLGSHSNFNSMKTGPDAVYDRLTEVDTAPKVNVNHYVDNNSSNVDGISNIGYNINFNFMKAGPDGASTTLREKNLGGGLNSWTTPTAIQSSCGGNPGVLIDGLITTDWVHLVKEYHWVVFDMGSIMNITKVRAYTAAYALVTIRVLVSNSTSFTDQDVVVQSWDPVLGGWNDSPEFNRRGRYIRLDHIWNTFSSQQMKFAFYEFQAWTTANYRLDLESQFTNVLFNTTYVKLCLYVMNATAEDLNVDYWNGNSWVNLFQDIFAGWNNVSIKSYLTGPTFTIRFRDATMSQDGVQDSWQIDALLIRSWTPPKYQLDLEARFTNIISSTTYVDLCIYSGALGSEGLRVDVWTGSSWATVISSIQEGWTNASIKDYATQNVIIRFVDNGSTDSTTQESWNIDVALIHSWTPLTYNYQLDLEVQFNNIDFSEVNNELCIYASNLNSENISVQVWTGSAWTTVMAGLKPNSWNNASVNPTSANFTYRFIDANRISDTSPGSWQIDAVLLHSWTTLMIDYRLDLEVQFTNVDYAQENKILAVYAGNLGNETLTVEIWRNGWGTLLPSLSSGWNNISVNNYLSESTFTIRFKDSGGVADTRQNSWQIDAVLLHLWTIGGYKLSLEEQFTDVTYNSDNITLAIRTGTMGSESLRVDIWYQNAWVNLLQSLPANQWSNISLVQYVSSSTVTLRFMDGNQNDDPGLDTWQIDAVLLNLATGTRYKLDLETQFTNINYYGYSGEICVKTGTLGNESILFDYWNGQSWQSIRTLNANSWNNMSVSLENINLTVRFRDGQQIRDKTKNTWQIDCIYLHTWQTEISNPTINRATATSANQWYYKWWGLRTISVVNATDSYEIHGNSTSEGILSYNSKDWNPEDSSVLTAYDGSLSYNITDLVKTEFGGDLEYQNHIQIEYVILFAEPSGYFQFASNSHATAANDQDKYDGTEYWHINTVTCKNFEESSDAIVLGF